MSTKVMKLNSGQYLPQSNHIDGLDALRTLAIAGVTLFHMFPEYIKGGYMGVSLFFVLTGFLLAYTSENERNAKEFSFGKYFLKRIKRIYPSLIIMLLTTVGAFCFLLPDAVTNSFYEILSVLGGYNNWWQIAQNADYFTRLTSNSPFTHLWFMGIELQYYLLWPLIFLLYASIQYFLGRGIGIMFVGLLAVGSAILMPLQYQPDMDVTRLYYGTDTRIYALLFGAVLGLWQANAKRSHAYSIWGSIGVAAVFLSGVSATIISYLLMGGYDSFTYQEGMLLMTVVFCLLIYLLANADHYLTDILENPLCKEIGRRSYGIFLWQYPIIYLFGHFAWAEIPYYYVIELAVIWVLSVWSDALSDSIVNMKLSYVNKRFAVAKCALFLTVTLAGFVVMGFGCRGLAASATYVDNGKMELQTMLETNAAELAAQNEAAERAAAAARRQAAEEAVDLTGTVCIGDSVMLGSSKELARCLPGCFVDAAVSRYVGGGLEAAQAMAAEGKLGNLVVISLGTNGPIAGAERYEVQTLGLLQYLEENPEREIFWVNVHCNELKWHDTNNAYLAKLAAEHPHVHVVDWDGLVSGHPEWLVSDGIHPNDEGIKQYVKLIHDTMVKVLADKQLAS